MASSLVLQSDDMDLSDDEGGVALNLSSSSTFELAIRTQEPKIERFSSTSPQPDPRAAMRAENADQHSPWMHPSRRALLGRPDAPQSPDVSRGSGPKWIKKSPSDGLDPATQAGAQQHQQVSSPQSRYFQDPSFFVVPGAQLWRLPGGDTYLRRDADASMFNDVIDSMAGHIYAKSCKLIHQNWGCDAAEALPTMLHESTPYSLALLLQLRMLASYSKKNCLHAQSILVNQWQHRMNWLKVPQDFSGRTLRTTEVMQVRDLVNQDQLQDCERQIQENVFGLTLEDVAEAITIVKHEKMAREKGGQRAAKAVRAQDRPQTDEAYLKRQEKLARRREKKDDAKMAKQQKKQEKLLAKAGRQAAELMGTREVELPVRTSRRPRGPARKALAEPTAFPTLDDVRMQRLADQVDNVNSADAPIDAVDVYNQSPGDIMSSDPAEFSYEYSTGADRAAYNTLTYMMDTGLHMERLRTRTCKQRNKKVETLRRLAETGGRRASDLVTLPSERVDFGSLPTLHARIGDVKEQEMAEAMKSLELAQMGQQPLPPAPENTSYNISNDDNKWFRR